MGIVRPLSMQLIEAMLRRVPLYGALAMAWQEELWSISPAR